jgi:transmembrane sensor
MKRALTDQDTDPRLDEAGAWCLRLADGALEPADQTRFQAWLDADPENLRAFEDAVGVWRAVGDTSLTPELLALRRDALSGFETANRERWRKRRRPPLGRWIPTAVAACFVATLGGAWIVGTLLSPLDYKTGVGERRVVVLNDGSKLSLDAATEVKVRYSDKARQLWLEAGRAKFDVAKDPSRPFTVAAADKLVRATGTEFSVELVQGQVQVVLYEGHVAVFNHTDGAAPQPLKLAAPGSRALSAVEADVVLTPGRELVAPVQVARAEVIPADPVRSLAWEGGQLAFAGETLASAVERVNRYSDRKLKIGDPAAGAVRIDGIFTAGDTDAFVDGVTQVFPVRVRETADGEELVSR